MISMIFRHSWLLPANLDIIPDWKWNNEKILKSMFSVLTKSRIIALDLIGQESGVIKLPGYLPLIAQEWSNDQDTGLWLVRSAPMTKILASDWLRIITGSGGDDDDVMDSSDNWIKLSVTSSSLIVSDISWFMANCSTFIPEIIVELVCNLLWYHDCLRYPTSRDLQLISQWEARNWSAGQSEQSKFIFIIACSEKSSRYFVTSNDPFTAR